MVTDRMAGRLRSLIVAGLLAVPAFAGAGGLAGRVTDAESGSPVPGATVRVDSLGIGAIADSDGRFAIQRLPAGGHAVRVTSVGYRERRQRVTVSDSGLASLDLELTSVAIPGPPVEVTASAGLDRVRAPAFVTVVDSSWFEGRATSVADVLASSVGVKVRRLGGLGSFSTISVRGSTSEQVVVYLDGIQLNSATGGGVDLSTLPLSQVAEMEVHRGISSGGSAMGGTVYIRTPEADTSSGQAASVSWGSFDTRNLSAILRARRSRNRFLLVADYSSSDSDYGFLDDNGTEYSQADDAPAVRRNSDFLSAGLLGKWDRPVGASKVFVHGNLNWSRRGIPGISNNQSLEARFNTFRILAEGGLRIPSFLGRHVLEQRLTLSRKREHFIDRLGEVGVGQQDDEYETATAGSSTHLATVFGARARSALDFDLRWERYQPTRHLQTSVSLLSSSRWSANARGGLDATVEGSVVSVWGAVEALRSRTPEENPFRFTPEPTDSVENRLLVDGGVGLRVDLVEGLMLKANLGRSHRAPSFYELFGDRGGVIGKTDLRPERGVSWDVGIRLQRTPAAMFEAVYYDHRYHDLIQFVRTSQGTSRPFNIGSATVRGMEVTAQALPIERLRVSANYTLQASVDRSGVPHWMGNRLPGRPVHEVDARAEFSEGRWRVFYGYSFEAGSYLDRANLRPLDDRHVHEIGTGVDLVPALSLTVEGRNVLNNRVSDVWGYPLPGRAITIILKESF